MKHFAMTLLCLYAIVPVVAQQQMELTAVSNGGPVNDNNTPLHLMRPANQQRYGIPTTEQVKQTMDRVLHYIDAQTPAVLVDRRTGQEVKRMKDIIDDDIMK